MVQHTAINEANFEMESMEYGVKFNPTNFQQKTYETSREIDGYDQDVVKSAALCEKCSTVNDLRIDFGRRILAPHQLDDLPLRKCGRNYYL